MTAPEAIRTVRDLVEIAALLAGALWGLARLLLGRGEASEILRRLAALETEREHRAVLDTQLQHLAATLERVETGITARLDTLEQHLLAGRPKP